MQLIVRWNFMGYAKSRLPSQFPPSAPPGGSVHSLDQSCVPGTAHRETRAVSQDGNAALFTVRLDARDPLQVYEVRAVDAHEACGIEVGLELRDGLLFEPCFAISVERDIVVLRLGIVEL